MPCHAMPVFLVPFLLAVGSLNAFLNYVQSSGVVVCVGLGVGVGVRGLTTALFPAAIGMCACVCGPHYEAGSSRLTQCAKTMYKRAHARKHVRSNKTPHTQTRARALTSVANKNRALTPS